MVKKLPVSHELGLERSYIWGVIWDGAAGAPSEYQWRTKLRALGLAPSVLYNDGVKMAGFIRAERPGVLIAHVYQAAIEEGATKAAVVYNDSWFAPDFSIWVNEWLQEAGDTPKDVASWWERWRTTLLIGSGVVALATIAIVLARKK